MQPVLAFEVTDAEGKVRLVTDPCKLGMIPIRRPARQVHCWPDDLERTGGEPLDNLPLMAVRLIGAMWTEGCFRDLKMMQRLSSRLGYSVDTLDELTENIEWLRSELEALLDDIEDFEGEIKAQAMIEAASRVPIEKVYSGLTELDGL